MSLYKTSSDKSLHLTLSKSGERGGASTINIQVRQRNLSTSRTSPSSSSAGDEPGRQDLTPGLLRVNPPPHLLVSSLPWPPPLYQMESPQNCPAPPDSLTSYLILLFLKALFSASQDFLLLKAYVFLAVSSRAAKPR